MTPDDVKKALDDAESAYWAAVDSICARVITENIRPFCIENSVRFVSGMGGWNFDGESAKATYENPEKLWASYDPSELPKDLANILSQELINNSNDLGSIAGDFVPDNFKG